MDSVDMEGRECRRMDLPSWAGQWLDSTEPDLFQIPQHLRLIVIVCDSLPALYCFYIVFYVHDP